MRILVITAAGAGDGEDLPPSSVLERARALQTGGHDVTVLRLHPARGLLRWSTGAEAARHDGVEVLTVRLPAIGGGMRRALPSVLRRVLPRALRAHGVQRPDLVHADAELCSLSAAQVLSVQSGVPHLVVALDELAAVPEARHDHEVVGHALQEAIAIAATPKAQRELQRRWFVPALETLAPAHEAWDQGRELGALSARALERAGGPRMVFHAPYALVPSPSNASRQRPNMMLQGFGAAGHRVHLVTGDPLQRRRDFADLRRRRRAGQRLAFVYSENSTQPNLLSTSAFRGLAPFLEARLLAWCARHGIPFGQFYRDVYWRFSEKQASVAPLRRLVMQLGYCFDLAALRLFGAHFFLPSMRMAPIVPVPDARSSELPPGAQLAESGTGDGRHLLYVGGVGPGHEIDELLAALRDVEGFRLTMVVPRPLWEAQKERYRPSLTERVRVLHASADELDEIYDGAAACLLFVEPNKYRDFAVPMKLYEYLGHGKPTLASAGTYAGTLVEDLGIGFTAPNERTQIAALLERLLADPAALERCSEHVRRVRHEQTWAARARTVAAELTEGGTGR